MGRTVACAFALTGELSAAEDLAQEAYSRAWPRWGSLQAYDDPGALGDDGGARRRLASAAGGTTARSRVHHLAELPVTEVARLERCPEGTVKAILSRGRAALAELLGDHSDQNGEHSHA